jgi:hypothetical protein
VCEKAGLVTRPFSLYLDPGDWHTAEAVPANRSPLTLYATPAAALVGVQRLSHLARHDGRRRNPHRPFAPATPKAMNLSLPSLRQSGLGSNRGGSKKQIPSSKNQKEPCSAPKKG